MGYRYGIYHKNADGTPGEELGRINGKDEEQAIENYMAVWPGETTAADELMALKVGKEQKAWDR